MHRHVVGVVLIILLAGCATQPNKLSYDEFEEATDFCMVLGEVPVLQSDDTWMCTDSIFRE